MTSITSVIQKVFGIPLRTLALGTTTFLGLSTPAEAGRNDNPALVQIIEGKAKESFTPLKSVALSKDLEAINDKNIRWNDAIFNMLLGGESNLEGIDEIRNWVLEEGLKNHQVPFRVVQVAIYTAGELGKAIDKEIVEINNELKILRKDPAPNKTEIEKREEEIKRLRGRREKTLALTTPYFNKNIIDTINNNSEIIGRQIIPVSQVNASKGNKSNRIHTETFPELVSATIASLSDRTTPKQDSSNQDLGYKTSYLDILLHLEPESIPKSTLDEMHKFSSVRLGLLSNTSSEEQNQPPMPMGMQELKVANFHTKNEEEKSLTAKEILLLAQANDDRAEDLCKKWFESKPANSPINDSDYIALRALALSGKNHNGAFNLLKSVFATFPHLATNPYTAYNSANITSENITTKNLDLYLTGQGLNDLLNARGNESTDFLLSIVNNSKDLLFSSMDSDTEAEKTKKAIHAKQEALKIVSTLLGLKDSKPLITSLRSIVSDNNEDKECRITAMVGLGRIHDRESIPELLNIFQTSSDPEIKREALGTIIMIDSPDFPTNPHYDEAIKANPYGLDLSLFSSPFDRSGDFRPISFTPHTISTEIGDDRDKSLLAFTSGFDGQYGGNLGHLKAGSADLNPKLIDYLNSCKDRKTKPDLATMLFSMQALAKMNSPEAENVFVDLFNHPEQYIARIPINQVITNARHNGQNKALLTTMSLELIGDVLDLRTPDSDASKLLRSEALSDLSPVAQMTANRSLFRLANRYEVALKDSSDSILRDSAREHISKLLSTLTSHVKRISTPIDQSDVPRLDWAASNRITFLQASSIIKMGGEKELLETIAKNGWTDDKNNTLHLAILALIANEKTPDFLDDTNIDRTIAANIKNTYKRFLTEELWLGDVAKSGLTGDGVEVAVLDGGPVSSQNLSSTLSNAIEYPKKHGTKNYGKTHASQHANTVANIIHRLAPKAKLHTYTWDESYEMPNPLRPHSINDPALISLENIIREKLSGKSDIKLINCSFGIKSHDSHDFLRLLRGDLRSAGLESANNIGIVVVTTAGNDHTLPVSDHTNGTLHEVSPLGWRVTDEGYYSPLPGTTQVAAFNSALGKFAPTTSSQHPQTHSPENKSIGVNGLGLVFHRFNGNFHFMNYTATSFAAPRLTGLIALLLEDSGKSEVRPENIKDVIFLTSDEVTGRSPHQDNKVVNPTRVLDETRKLREGPREQGKFTSLKNHSDNAKRQPARSRF